MRVGGLGSWPAGRARMTPGRTAIVPGDERVSYADLACRTGALAHRLRELGARPGDRVGYLGPDHPAYLVTLFATASLGAVFVPVNARLTAPEWPTSWTTPASWCSSTPPARGPLVDAAAGPRLHARLGPDQGHDRLRRGERLPGRGRVRALRAPRRRAVRGRRGAGQHVG